MNKKIIVLIVLICVSCSGLFADDFWGFGSKGASIAMDIISIAVGGGLVAVPLVDPFETEELAYVMYGIGGLWVFIGLLGLIYDGVSDDSNYYSMKDKDPILEHVSFNVLPNTLYVGGIWRF